MEKSSFVPTWLRKTFERKMLHSHFCTILFFAHFALFERYLLRRLYCTLLYGFFFSPQVHGWLNALTDAFIRYFAEIAWFCKMGPEPFRNSTTKSFCYCNFNDYFHILNFFGSWIFYENIKSNKTWVNCQNNSYKFRTRKTFRSTGANS